MGQPQQQAVANRQPAQAPQQNAVVQKQKSLTVSYVDAMQGEWAKVLPSYITPERFARVVLSCLNGNPKIAEALQTKEGKISLSKSIMQSAESGLELNGYEAHLVPFRTKNGWDIQYMPDYKGLVKLMRNSGQISTIMPEVVCEHDKFTWKNGVINHEINWFEPRGKAVLWYVVVTLKDGSMQTKVMNKDDIEAIRARSRSKDNGPWVTDYNAMALKTVIKNISKLLPRSAELMKAIQYDNENDFPQLVDVTPQTSRFAGSKSLPKPNGSLIGALRGQAPVEQTVETQFVPQNDNSEPQKPQDIEEAINNALAERQAPVGYNQLREWYEIEHGQWDPVEVFNNLDNCINRTLDWLESTANNNNA